MCLPQSSFISLFIHSFARSQIGLLGLQVIWTTEATEALKNARSDKKIMQATDDHFQEILDMLIEMTTKELTKIERTKFETLITIHLHQRDIFHALVSLSESISHNIQSSVTLKLVTSILQYKTRFLSNYQIVILKLITP